MTTFNKSWAIALCVCMGVSTTAYAASSWKVWAGPSIYGNWETIHNHIGPHRIRVEVSPIGKTVVTGQIEYFDANHKKTVRDFYKTTTVETGNSIGTVRVRLKGTPTGSSCNVTVHASGR